MNCNHCGQIMEENAPFCPNCGKSVNEAPAAPAAEETHTYESAPAAQVNTVPVSGQKSKLVAGLLGILCGFFLGGLGIHNFYLGYTKKAVIQLVVCLAGSCLIVGPLVSGIWCMVEGIQILTGKINVDANGVPLKD